MSPPKNITIGDMNQTLTTTHFFLRSSPKHENESVIEIQTDEEEEKDPKEAEYIFCKQCEHRITRPEESILVNGQHHHTFANPHGLVFEIGCFQIAEGCGYTGQSTEEWSWFTGYKWRIAVCGKCLTQLGWLFSSSIGGNHFNGLILDRLCFP